MIRRPTSSMHAEIGIKTHEGFFQPIARSGRADFPRNAPSPNALLDWMTVTSGGAPPCVAPFRSRYSGPEPPLPGSRGRRLRRRVARGLRADARRARDPRASTRRWSGPAHDRARRSHVERWWRLDEWRAEWRAGPALPRAGSTSIPSASPSSCSATSRTTCSIEGGEMVVYGPWRITIRDFGTEPGRRVLSTWSMRWVRATTPMIERWERVDRAPGRLRLGARALHDRRLRGARAARARRERAAAHRRLRAPLARRERVGRGAARSETCGSAASSLLFLGASEQHGRERVARRAASTSRRSRFAERANVGTIGEQWAGRARRGG